MSSLTPTGIAYDDKGDGQTTLLFLPGWCGPRTLFDPLREQLDDRMRCLSLDWRGHGESKSSDADFGTTELVDDAAEVIAHAEAEAIVPVAAAHAGWVAIELRRRLGATRVPELVLIDWMVTGAPPPFLGALQAMATPGQTRHVVDQVTDMWVADLDIPELSDYVAAMRKADDDMWARAAREIGGAFRRDPSPLEAIAALESPPPTLHLYAQPADEGFLGAQQRFAASHPWFAVERLDARSHFPMFEVPVAMAERIGEFLGG
ncbi:MAG: alpha/beta hydrolase [Actinobacteria bacterium]|nr:alpha/beta hydrolase [Actinomycetota bacterium]